MEVLLVDKLHQVQGQHWWYVARRRILDGVLRSLVDAGLPNGTLYDIGCGVGANLPVLERYGPAVGIDTSPEAVAYCKERGLGDVRLGDIDTLAELPEDSGSVVLLADVIEHLDDEDGCLRAAHRLLKKGGALVVTVPAFQFLWSVSDDINHHRRRYTESQLSSTIARHFAIEKTTYFNTLLFAPIAAGRFLEKVLKRPGTEGAILPPRWLNFSLTELFAAEGKLLDRVHLPFGVSVLCVARKRD